MVNALPLSWCIEIIKAVKSERLQEKVARGSAIGKGTMLRRTKQVKAN